MSNKHDINTKSGLHKVCFTIGLVLLGVSGGVAVLCYGISPLFTGEPWIVASPPLHFLSIVVSATIVWVYMRKDFMRKGKSIDHHFRTFLIYRIVRSLFFISLGLIGFILKVIFFAWIRQSPTQSHHSRERTADDIWDTHPEHYYDNEPPKPFSK